MAPAGDGSIKENRCLTHNLIGNIRFVGVIIDENIKNFHQL